jgi:hypothetical protein
MRARRRVANGAQPDLVAGRLANNRITYLNAVTAESWPEKQATKVTVAEKPAAINATCTAKAGQATTFIGPFAPRWVSETIGLKR